MRLGTGGGGGVSTEEEKEERKSLLTNSKYEEIVTKFKKLHMFIIRKMTLKCFYHVIFLY